jgi:hypothetical protein
LFLCFPAVALKRFKAEHWIIKLKVLQDREVSSYHTLACVPCEKRPLLRTKPMTKAQVLMIFARSGRFLKPDDVLVQLKPRPDRRSLYSYLDRLRKQGLLDRYPNSRRGQLAFILTERGRARLEYFRRNLPR